MLRAGPRTPTRASTSREGARLLVGEPAAERNQHVEPVLARRLHEVRGTDRRRAARGAGAPPGRRAANGAPFGSRSRMQPVGPLERARARAPDVQRDGARCSRRRAATRRSLQQEVVGVLDAHSSAHPVGRRTRARASGRSSCPRCRRDTASARAAGPAGRARATARPRRSRRGGRPSCSPRRGQNTLSSRVSWSSGSTSRRRRRPAQVAAAARGRAVGRVGRFQGRRRAHPAGSQVARAAPRTPAGAGVRRSSPRCSGPRRRARGAHQRARAARRLGHAAAGRRRDARGLERRQQRVDRALVEAASPRFRRRRARRRATSRAAAPRAGRARPARPSSRRSRRATRAAP